jgi:hypothetical protein
MRRRGGYTLIELVLVLFLLVLVASSVFVLAASGSRAFLRLSARLGEDADLRTGLSYLDVQIHKHDSQNALSIRPAPFGESGSSGIDQALVITQEIEGSTYLTWIYIQDGYLCELFVEEGIAVNPDMGSRIVKMDGLQLRRVSPDAMQIVLVRQTENPGPGGADAQTATRIVYLRAGGVADE